MRSHAEIIEQNGGYSGFADKLTARGFSVAPARVRFWQRRKSIPPETWADVAKTGLVSLEELAEAAARKSETQAAA